jgi:UDP-glucose 4-epimerase
MKKVVVTGGAGFIGSHLAEVLAARGYPVVIIDDLSTGKIENIRELLNNPSVEFVKGSVTDLQLLKKLFRDAVYVFHLAAIASVPRSIENPQASHEVNVGGTLNMLLAAKENSVSKVIYSSSAAVYGDIGDHAISEDMVPHPLSPYAATKLAGDYYCQVFNEIYHLPTVCLRCFNIYGPRQDPDSHYASVISEFIKRVSQGNSPVIFGDGKQTRDFIFVADVVAVNILTAENDVSGVFNIARGESVTINQLAGLIIELSSSNVRPIYEEPRPGDIRHSLADITKAKAFGYDPKYTLRDGLTETIRWPFP